MSFLDNLTTEERALFNDIKNDLDYTFSDDGMDKKLMSAIRRGKTRLDDIAGHRMDYSLAGEHQSLLLNYCRYDLAGKRDEFEKNYRSQIVGLQIDREAEAYAEKNGL